jgi:phospholipid/cholesterol/gamma-HCH transport system substrate-binding protein
MDGTQAAVTQVTGALKEARSSLKKVDAILVEAQGLATNARVASTDLGALRAEVELSLRKVSQLVDEVNRKWPFARDVEIKLP